MEALGYCLNCKAQLEEKFCKYCGQKASTGRLSFYSFLRYDLLEGVLDVHQGVIRALWELLLRPGYSVRDYIGGKRVGQPSILALMVLILALVHNVEIWLTGHGMPAPNTHAEVFVWILNSYYKAIYLSMIPMLSVLTWLIFRKLEYNFTEHLVLNSYALAGGFLVELVVTMIEYLIYSDSTGNVSFLFFFIYPAYTYYQATKGFYALLGFCCRVLLVVGSFILILMLFFRIMYALDHMKGVEQLMPVS